MIFFFSQEKAAHFLIFEYVTIYFNRVSLQFQHLKGLIKILFKKSGTHKLFFFNTAVVFRIICSQKNNNANRNSLCTVWQFSTVLNAKFYANIAKQIANMIRLRLILNNEIDRKRTDWYVVIGNTLSSVAIMQLGIIIHNSLGANGCEISMNYKYYGSY